MNKFSWFYIFIVVVSLCFSYDAAFSRSKRHSRKRYYPKPTHPVILWARTLSESGNLEKRRVAAFKFSQYNQKIFQDSVVSVLLECMKDSDDEISSFCTKGLSNVSGGKYTDIVRESLLEQMSTKPKLRSIIVSTFIARNDDDPKVHDFLLSALKKSKSLEEKKPFFEYFEKFGSGSDVFVNELISLYKAYGKESEKLSIIKILAERARGQSNVVELLTTCASDSNTPLALTCMAGLESQARTDNRTWLAIEKNIERSDTDIVYSTLDLINVLPEKTNVKIAGRLIELIKETDDEEIQEKAVLALGSTGDQSQEIVSLLIELILAKSIDESIKIAAVLTLGKQGLTFFEEPINLLTKCSENLAYSPNFRTACQLGLEELNKRRKIESQKKL